MTSKPVRKLSAIMFADMVGFTALMEQNERQAFENRERQREVMERLIPKYHGEILQFFGDGVLCIFQSAIEGVECAVEIQQELNQEPMIPLRIGLHTGDVVIDHDGIYGDGVNIASRIESLSVPGGILVSDKVFDDIKNQPDLKTVSLGKFELKNVAREVGVYAVSNSGINVPRRNELDYNKATKQKSIAVLPFVNMSTDPENEFFSDGITEEILNALVRVDGLQVTSRTSSFAFKNKNEDIRQIGRQLGVENVLEGSVRKSGNKVRITAQLIKASDGYHLWSETYDRSIEDIFDVQDEISQKIAHQMREHLTRKESIKPMVQAPTQNMEAYNQYLKGVYYWNKWAPENIKKAILIFEKLIETEPDFALPYAALANCYSFLSGAGQIDGDEGFPKAAAAAKKAIELDDTLYQSHLAMALVEFLYNWNVKASKAYIEKAKELAPGAADVYHVYGMHYSFKGDHQKAIELFKHSLKLDPLSSNVRQQLAFNLIGAGEYEESLAVNREALKADPNFRAAKESMGWTYSEMGQYEEALKWFKDYHKDVGNPLKGLTGMAHVYAKMGNREKAMEFVEKMNQRVRKEPFVNLGMDFATIYEALGDRDKALDYCRESIKMGMGWFYIRSSSIWAELRKDPRFPELQALADQRWKE